MTPRDVGAAATAAIMAGTRDIRPMITALTTAVTTLALATPLEVLASPSEADVRAHISVWEGYRLRPYTDPSGDAVCVGIGHNLTAHRQRVKWQYTDAEVLALFHDDYTEAVRTARRSVYQFDTLPDDIQTLVLAMVFTLGPTGFHRWAAFRLALSTRSYTAAARELFRSKWAGQVGGRRAGAYWGVLVNHSFTTAPLPANTP